jgi:hypothetical protein
MSVLCFTRVEASTLRGVEVDLTVLRTEELGSGCRGPRAA